ncbi:MAG: hypothetical protein U0V72_06650 [Cytophagales bacterium]
MIDKNFRNIIRMNIIRKIAVVLAISPLSFFAQDAITGGSGSKSDLSFVKVEKVTKFYTKEELNKLPKLDLLQIYKSRLEYLIEVLPFISLNPAPGATFHDMSIPETEANKLHLEKETKNKQEFISSMNETLDDVIPYSEKVHLVWSILFFDKIIKESNYTVK